MMNACAVAHMGIHLHVVFNSTCMVCSGIFHMLQCHSWNCMLISHFTRRRFLRRFLLYTSVSYVLAMPRLGNYFLPDVSMLADVQQGPLKQQALVWQRTIKWFLSNWVACPSTSLTTTMSLSQLGYTVPCNGLCGHPVFVRMFWFARSCGITFIQLKGPFAHWQGAGSHPLPFPAEAVSLFDN